MLKHWLNRFGKETLFIAIFVLLYKAEPSLGFTYLGLEGIFMASLFLCWVAKRKALYQLSMRLYYLNRLTGLMQPAITLGLMFYMQLSLMTHSLSYGLLLVDIILTLLSMPQFAKHVMPVKVRTANLNDIDALYDIEKQNDDASEQASREQIKKRLLTQNRTCLVAEDSQGQILGSIYAIPVNQDKVIANKASHQAMLNNNDFTPPMDYDSLYVVGIQAKETKDLNTAHYLQAGLAKLAIREGYEHIIGGPRLPEYHLNAHIPLDAFIRSADAKLLHHFIAQSKMPGLGQSEIICGLENYFPDKDSLNCAALITWKTPFLSFKAPIRKALASLFFSLALIK